MTTTSTFASLALPAPEDTMEMSSPAHPDFDDDIEIDFGDFSRGAQDMDDDQMIEDSEVRPLTGTDAAMEYDVHTETVPVNEEEMSDDVVDDSLHIQEEDDELIDYDDEEDHTFQEQVDPTHAYEDSIPSVAPVMIEQVDVVDEDASNETIRQSGDDFAEQQSLAHGRDTDVEEENAGTAEFPSIDSIGGGSEPAELAYGDQEVSQIADVATAESREVPHVSIAGSISAEVDDVVDPKTTDAPPRLVTVDSNTSTHGERLDSPTDTGLHPVTLHFEEEEMPLFKSHAHQDGLLKDDNLVNVSLADMMNTCRQRLLVKRSKVIPDDHELVVSFEGLPLTVYELSHAAFEVSLSEILTIYLHLQRNDGLQDIPPLSLVLSSQLKVTSSLAILKQAAAEGFGMPDIEQTSEHDDFKEEQEEEGGVVREDDYRAEEHGQDQEQYGEGIHGEDGEVHIDTAKDEQDEPEYAKVSDAEDSAAVDHDGHIRDGFADTWTQEEGYERDNTGHAVDHSDVKAVKAGADTATYAQTGNEVSFEHSKALDGEVDDDDLQHRVVVGTHTGHPATSEPLVDNVAKSTSTASSTTVVGDFAGHEVHNLTEPSYGDDPLFPGATENESLDNHDEDFQRGGSSQEVQLDESRAPTFRAHSPLPTQGVLEEYPALGSEDLLPDLEDEEEDAEDTRKDGDEEELSAYTQHQADSSDEQQHTFQPGGNEDQYPEAEQPLTDDLYDNNEEHLAQDNEHEQPNDTVEDGSGHLSPADEDEDHIDFDDDTTEQHEARKASQPNILHLDSPSQSGKRTFDEHVADDEIDFDEPELKRARS